jgi:hypothetical protein
MRLAEPSFKPLKAYEVVLANYFGLSAGGGVASAGGVAAAAASWAWPAAVWAASAALVAELAEAAAESAAAPAGAGVASVVAGAVLAASCFAQAVSISAAIRALRASLVFIDQYPERSKSGGGLIEFCPAIRHSRIAAQNSIELRSDLKYVSAASDRENGN